ncbi:hypothetical protein [Microvirga yunnanensis]|uniref:hypothetical protein n=1 Tax=Microvirga yunnanensis TaxID=2953740 RepID=UPI0021CADC64|nr:hypothetical protein [Microvirga sp. HBU65207]
MATLILSSHPASSDGSGFNSIHFHLDGSEPPLPQESVEIRTAADAAAAFEQYSERATASSKGIWITASLRKGQRAPSGFRKLKLDRFVNV